MAISDYQRDKLGLCLHNLIALTPENREKLLAGLPYMSEEDISAMLNTFQPYMEKQDELLKHLFSEHPEMAREGEMLLQEVARHAETDSVFSAELEKLSKINSFINL